MRMPRIHRNTPDTDAPTTPVTECRPELSFVTGPTRVFTPSDSRKASPKTIVEWPSENQKPTESGLRTVGSSPRSS